MLVIGSSGSGETNALLNLLKEQDDNLKFDLYANDLNEPKYLLLINKREDAEIKHLNDPKAFIDHSSIIDDVYDLMTNKRFQAIIKELYIRCRILNISHAFINSLIFLFQKKSLNYTRYLITNIKKKKSKLLLIMQQILIIKI